MYIAFFILFSVSSSECVQANMTQYITATNASRAQHRLNILFILGWPLLQTVSICAAHHFFCEKTLSLFGWQGLVAQLHFRKLNTHKHILGHKRRTTSSYMSVYTRFSPHKTWKCTQFRLVRINRVEIPFFFLLSFLFYWLGTNTQDDNTFVCVCVCVCSIT